MTKVFRVPEASVNYIERLDYEQRAKRDLLMEFAGRGMTGTDAYAWWEAKYIEAYSAWEMAKAELQQEYVDPLGAQGWSLNYRTNELTVTFEDKPDAAE